ncbi:MAG: 16S rRNA (guanine(966)-N(2))-methyltransferase RsmD [Alphaproteobacteria bacterium]|nr:16S rRNA (guanine(966)-N(2))-methyltransferase RsmD [Alphaproteobacteria bacterium]
MLRIVAGLYRGKKLFAPSDENVRPTSDRAREAIFSILYSKIGPLENKTVLDVFAGTGAIGFEALSRGAKSVSMIDKDTSLILKNAALFEKEKNRLTILKADIASLPRSNTAFDVVFSDAPYDKGLNETALCNLTKNGFIKNGALCIIETRHNENLVLPDNFELIDERHYGMAKVGFYVFSFQFSK